ncbi:zinc finger protein 653 isoform X1 [Phyllopteryx taeniolatus]|uniref:zinc finger protein 653 isoform X1 n=2 Tax=Phyllopteryx taeniolatus TaxID=161469 RepID=UPI002AD29E1A|nr:zinc finger protein 653 isoform X1 [Phyllopteryx taeniolatus]
MITASAVVAKMAHNLAELEVPLVVEPAGDRGKDVLRRCRGRPRLTDSDRAQRRLESRKKYDIRRVYLGESYKLWSELRRRTSLSDAGLAAMLIVLHSTFGEKYQQRLSGKAITPEGPDKSAQKREVKRERESSLHSLVCWYQEHLRSCPHEPHLRSLEPQPNFSTAAIWQCDSDHSFVQHLFSPLREASDSEREERENGEDDVESAAKKDVLVPKRFSSQKRKTNALLKDLGETMVASEGQHTITNDIEQTEVVAPHASVETSSNDVSLTVPHAWEMEMVLERRPQGSPEAMFHSLASEEEIEDVRRSQAEGAREEQEEQQIGCDYECVTVGASFVDKLRNTDEDLSNSVPPAQQELLVPSPIQAEEKGQLFDPHSLQTVVTSCQIPNQQTNLEGSQLIIITGATYDGIQLNVGAGHVEEDACTVIGGVTYNQVCEPESKMQQAEYEDSMTGLSNKLLLQPTVDNLELNSDRELQRRLSRSKRNRRGPVIEADGMLKMFHCPYEGCSQVYVAISSFQNHVNLVHRKGRTKVCPHPGCGKKFYLSNHLHRHMIIHSGVRDFICETCGKSFKRKNHLEVHRRTHTGETPLQCEICGYQCRQRASLNWHMKKHTPEAHYNYPCEFCDKRFEKLDSVKFHKLKSHPEKLSS